MRKSTGIILWVLIFSFGILWMLQDTNLFSAIQHGPNSLGEVNGERISLEAYNNRLSYYIDQFSQRTGNSITPEMRAYYEEQAWQDLVTGKLIQQKMDELGISVTDQEVVNMITGPNPDPFIRQQFQKKNGSIDRVALQAAIEAPENNKIWLQIEQQLRQKKRQQKMTNYVQSAMQVSKDEIKEQFINNNTYADISYVRFPYADVPDSTVEVSESDLKSYYNNHKEKFHRKKSFRFEYVGFDKTPTSEDTTRTINELNDLRDDFAGAQSDSLFLARYQSTTPYNNRYVKTSDVRDEFKPVLDLKEGEVSEVKQEGGTVYLLKKLDQKGNTVKFDVLSFQIKADPVATIDKKAEAADDFSYFAEKDGFDSEAKRRNLAPKEAFATKDNAFIAGLGQSRQIMNFLESAEEGKISKPIELSNQFVVLHVTQITPEGTRPFNEVKNQIRSVVVNNKRKDQIAGRVTDLLASNSSLEALADAAGKKVATADNLGMDAMSIPGAGREPEIVGSVFGLKEGATSEALKGQSAVFVVKVNKRHDADIKNLDNAAKQKIRKQLEQQKSSAFASVWLDQLKKSADIVDHRDRLLRGQ